METTPDKKLGTKKKKLGMVEITLTIPSLHYVFGLC